MMGKKKPVCVHIKHTQKFFFRSVTLNTTYIMHEKNKGELSPEKVWKSSGYYVNTWVPPVEGSLSVKDWRILTYYVYVLETSDDFGKSSDACDGLC